MFLKYATKQGFFCKSLSQTHRIRGGYPFTHDYYFHGLLHAFSFLKIKGTKTQRGQEPFPPRLLRCTGVFFVNFRWHFFSRNYGCEVQTIKIQRFILRNHEIHLPDSSDFRIFAKKKGNGYVICRFYTRTSYHPDRADLEGVGETW